MSAVELKRRDVDPASLGLAGNRTARTHSLPGGLRPNRFFHGRKTRQRLGGRWKGSKFWFYSQFSGNFPLNHNKQTCNICPNNNHEGMIRFDSFHEPLGVPPGTARQEESYVGNAPL